MTIRSGIYADNFANSKKHSILNKLSLGLLPLSIILVVRFEGTI